MKHTSPTPPLEMLSHFSPLAPFFEIRGFRSKLCLLLRKGDEGLHPSTPQAFEKGLTETFIFVLVCADLFILYVYFACLSSVPL